MSATGGSSQRQGMIRNLASERDDGLLRQFHRDVLEPSFDPDELASVGWIAEGLRGEGETDVLAHVALGPDGEVQGGIVAEIYRECGVLLIGYLAVRPDLRGRGIGTLLMREVAPRFYEDPRVVLAVGEVHDPRAWSGIAGEEPLARLRFFERVGGRVLGVPFIQPALWEGGARVPGFLLLVFHADPSVCIERDGRTSISAVLVESFVRGYFESAEGPPRPADEQYASLVKRIRESPEIDVLPVSEYERVVPLSTHTENE